MSLNGRIATTTNPPGKDVFVTTRWTVVLQAGRKSSPHSDRALADLCQQYWYPLYEKMVALDVPGMIHTGNVNNGRETQGEHFITEESIAALSILRSPVFTDFPNLKLIVAHGGGSLPYQAGRFRLSRVYSRHKSREDETFDDRMRKFYFDTVLYAKEPIELLIKVVGVDNCLFGTDTPGSGSSINPNTGRPGDDLKPVVESIDWLTDDDRNKIFEGNARKIFTHLNLS